jgi:serine protease Do
MTIRRSFAAVLLLLLTGLTASGEGEGRSKITKLGKSATALVKCQFRGAQGSAFCIHAEGIFLTNEHVIRDETTVTLVLNSGSKTSKSYKARVLRSDKERDLALLQVEGGKDLPVLPLAADNTVSETDELVAFGFPFGSGLAVGKDDPAISVNVGKVTSLREKDGELHRIQLDAVLNPGNSGGPVLDKDGKVVGVVVSGVRGAGVNFAIPISHVHRFLARPEIIFDAPAVKLASIHEPAKFQARVITFGAAGKALELELLLKSPAGASRQLKMKLEGGRYQVEARPMPPKKGPDVLRLTALFPRGSVTGEVEDQPFKVGDKSVKFSEVRRLIGGSSPRVWLREGGRLRGELGKLGVSIGLGDASVAVDLGKAADVRFRLPAGLDSLQATIVARREGKEVGRFTRSLPVLGVPQDGDDEVFLDMEVAPLEKDKAVVKLDGEVADVAVGGGGRFLILHLPKLGKLAVFDSDKAKVVKLLPVKDNNLKFTAGQDKLVVALPDSRTIQRWSLKSWEQELSVPYPMKGEIMALSMGSATNGPIHVYSKEGFGIPASFQLGLDKLDRREVNMLRTGHHHFLHPAAVLHLRSSFDGKATGLWISTMTPSGMTWIHWEGTVGRSTYSHSSNGHVIPGRGGKALFTGMGAFSSIGMINANKLQAGADPNGRYVPAHHGDYYLYLGAAPSFANKNPGRTFEVHKSGLEKPVLRLSGIEVPSTNETSIKTDFTLDKRFHLVPEAQLLVVIPPSNDQLLLYRVNLAEALAKAK